MPQPGRAGGLSLGLVVPLGLALVPLELFGRRPSFVHTGPIGRFTALFAVCQRRACRLPPRIGGRLRLSFRTRRSRTPAALLPQLFPLPGVRLVRIARRTARSREPRSSRVPPGGPRLWSALRLHAAPCTGRSGSCTVRSGRPLLPVGPSSLSPPSPPARSLPAPPVRPRRAHSRFPGTVCRQRWTVRLGEVEPVFGQTGRVVLDITARTAHDGALKWTRAPSTPRAARAIFATFPSTCALPSGGRWSLRRVLQRPGRQRKRSSAKSSCGPSRTSSSAPSSPPCCNARCAPPRLTRRAPSCATCPGGCGATAWRPSTFAPPWGTTVPVTTPYYREKHARRAKRRPGLYPALVVLGIYDRCTPKLASDASRAVAMLSSLAEAQAQLRSDGIALDIKTLRSTAYRYAARARAAQQSAACGLLDRVTGKRVVVSLDGGRVRVRRKKRGPKTKKGRNRFHTDWKEPKLSSCTSSATTGDRLRRGPRSSTARSGDRRRSSPCCCRTRGRSASTPLTRCSSSPTARPGSGDASSASSPRSGSRRHRCWG